MRDFSVLMLHEKSESREDLALAMSHDLSTRLVHNSLDLFFLVCMYTYLCTLCLRRKCTWTEQKLIP